MGILLSHPTGNANVRGALEGLNSNGLLESFHTSIACFQGSPLYHLARGVLKDFRRREYPRSVQAKTYTYPWRELGRMAASKLHLQGALTHETGMFCVDRIYCSIDHSVARYVKRHSQQIDAVYTYEDCALHTFQEAKRNGMLCLYDLPTIYWRAKIPYQEEVRAKNLEWASLLNSLRDSEEKLARKDAELGLADKIYVASSFAKKTLLAYPGRLADVEVIPYGFPPVNTQRGYTPFRRRKIKALFVGGLSPNKGLPYLFKAVSGLEAAVELTVVGMGAIDRCPALRKALEGVYYIPSLPHDEVLKLMSRHDLLIFPSLFEGFGLVITEAMSQGTPVITTDRTCGPDVITHGTDGWIVPAGTSEPIRELLESFIDAPEQLQEAGKAAMQTAARRPWVCYEAELVASVQKAVLGNKDA